MTHFGCLYRGLGIKLTGAGVHDDDDNGEYRDLERELEDHLPFNEATPA
jgi:hypothetical protein